MKIKLTSFETDLLKKAAVQDILSRKLERANDNFTGVKSMEYYPEDVNNLDRLKEKYTEAVQTAVNSSTLKKEDFKDYIREAAESILNMLHLDEFINQVLGGVQNPA